MGSVLSSLSVSWVNPLLRIGYRRPLISEDLGTLPNYVRAATLAAVFDRQWHAFRTNRNSDGSRPKVHFFGAMVVWFMPWMIGILVAMSVFLAATLLVPTFIRMLIQYLTPGFDRSSLFIQNGYGISAALFGLQFVASVAQNYRDQLIRITMQNVVTLLTNAIYEKSIRLSQTAQKTFSEGKILNLVNVDTENLNTSVLSIPNIISAPIQIAISIYLLGQLIGVSVWGGAGVLIAVLLIQFVLLSMIIKLYMQQISLGDKRLHQMREILYGMKIIKYRALEDYFISVIGVIRGKQIRLLGISRIFLVLLVGMYQLAPMFMPIAAFSMYSKLGGSIEPSIIFPALTFFIQLFEPFLNLAESVPSIAQGIASWGRISAFLNADEIEELSTTTGGDDLIKDPTVAVSLDSASFTWPAVVATTSDPEDPHIVLSL
eukprot:jgi/Hompol1/5700/HPOL_001948-RA